MGKEQYLKKVVATFGMSMSMLWSAQYLKMSERIVTPVLENKINKVIDKNFQQGYVSIDGNKYDT